MSVGRRRAADGQTLVQTVSEYAYETMGQQPTATVKKRDDDSRTTHTHTTHTGSASVVFLPAESSSAIVIPAPPDATYKTSPAVPVIKRPATIVASMSLNNSILKLVADL